MILQALSAFIGCFIFPSLQNLPLWNLKGLITVIILHVGVSEPLYYFVHRFLHRVDFLFQNYHSLHHSSPVPHPFTGKYIYIYIYISKKKEKSENRIREKHFLEEHIMSEVKKSLFFVFRMVEKGNFFFFLINS